MAAATGTTEKLIPLDARVILEEVTTKPEELSPQAQWDILWHIIGLCVSRSSSSLRTLSQILPQPQRHHFFSHFNIGDAKGWNNMVWPATVNAEKHRFCRLAWIKEPPRVIELSREKPAPTAHEESVALLTDRTEIYRWSVSWKPHLREEDGHLCQAWEAVDTSLTAYTRQNVECATELFEHRIGNWPILSAIAVSLSRTQENDLRHLKVLVKEATHARLRMNAIRRKLSISPI
jgi:hypothetical protein